MHSSVHDNLPDSSDELLTRRPKKEKIGGSMNVIPCINLTAKFSRTMPSDAAKKAST